MNFVFFVFCIVNTVILVQVFIGLFFDCGLDISEVILQDVFRLIIE